MKRLAFPAVVACLWGLGLSAPPACAAYVVTLLEQNGNVVATGGGTIDLTDLTDQGGISSENPHINPANGIIVTGNVGSPEQFGSITGPPSFGSNGSSTFANSTSGDVVGVLKHLQELVLPSTYVSGHTLSDTATYNNQTFSSIGVTPGTYVWTWGTGAHADSFTLQVGPATATPEPASLTLLGIGAVGLFGYCRRQRKRAAV